MGWTFFNRPNGLTTKQVIENEFPVTLRERGTIVAHGMADGTYGGKVFYAAVRDHDTNEVWALIVLTRRSSGEFNFGYKEMSENVGPGEAHAPKRVLDALTPTDNEWALAWREDCRKNLARVEQLKALRPGDIVRFSSPVEFSDGRSFTEMRLLDAKRNLFTPIDSGFRYRLKGWRDLAAVESEAA